MAVKFANLASTTLASATTNSATSLAVSDASSFPSLGGGDYFYASIGEGVNSEIVKVTAVSSNTLTVTRGQDGTTAAAHSAGTVVALRVVAAALDDIASQAQSAADTESVSIAGDTMTGTLNMGANAITSTGTISSGAITASGSLDLQVDGSNENAIIRETGYVFTTASSGLFGLGLRNSGSSGSYNVFEAQTGSGAAFQVRNNGDARVLRDLKINGTTRIAQNGNATLGTISSGAITTNGPVNITGNASYVGNFGYNTLVLQDDSGYPGINFRDGSKNWLVRKNGVNDNLQFNYSSNASGTDTGTYSTVLTIIDSGGLNLHSGNLENVGTISSGAITSTGSSSLGDQTLYISTGNYVGINTTAHVSTVLNVLDVDDVDVTLRLHTSTNSHKPIIRMNAKNSAGNSQYGDIKWNPDSPSFNFHIPYNEATPTLRISDGAISVDGTLTVSGNFTVHGTTTTLNTATLQVEDKNIVLNYGTSDTSGSADGAGITIQDAVDANNNATILWDATNDEFDFSHSVKVAGSLGVTNIVTNKVVKFGGTFLDDSNITDTGSLITLGSATTVSSDLSVTGDLKMAGSDSYIWTPNTTTGFTGFWDSNNSRSAARYQNNFGGWGILGEPESGTELKVHGKIKATDLQVFKNLPAGGGDNDTFHWNQVHAAISDNSGANTYVILDTAVPQDSYSMGGFTLICFNEYDTESEGDVIHIYGYWNPESNGGFKGFRYVCSNPDFKPTIQVGRNSSGNTAFLISGFGSSYAVMVARDLYLGYTASNAAASWGDGWAFSQASTTTGYSNLNTLDRIGITDTQISNITTAHNYSQVGHLPLAGGTLTGRVTFPTGSTTRPILAEGFFARTTSDTSGTHDIWGISGDYNPSASSAADQWGIQWSGSPNEINFIGAGQKKLSIDLDAAGDVEVDGNRIWDAGDFTSTNITNWNTAYTYSQVGHLPLAGGTLTGNLTIGDGTTRKDLKIKSNSYAEVQYSIKHANNSNVLTEYIRAGVAVSNAGFGQVIGDYYLYTPQSNKMLLTVPQNGDPLERNNGAITIIDTTNYDDYALPLSGGTLTGSLTAENTIVGDGANISMDASANGHLEISGSGYTGAIALDGNDMHFYHNSSERGIVFGTNETNRVKITSSGQLETYYDLNSYQAQKWYVSTSDSAHQRMDVRDEGIESRAHWYGVRSNAGTSNFRHAWYDGDNYINVTASNNQVLFQPDNTAPISLNLNSTSTSSNPAFLLLGGKNSSSQEFRLEIANRGAHSSAAFADKIDFSVYNNGTYFYSALRFDLYGGVETKQHIGNAQSPYAGDDRYFKFTNDVAGKSGTLVTADNGNTWLNADGGRDLWLNWYSLSNSASHADLQVGDGEGGGAILTVVGVDRRVGILDTSPSYPLDVTGDIRSTGTVRADSGIYAGGKVTISHSNLGAEPYVGLEVKNPSSSGDRLTGVAVDAALQSHYRYMLGGVTKWQSRVGGGAAVDDWRLYSFTTASDILTVKPSGEGQLRLFKENKYQQWTDSSGNGSISISGYGGQGGTSNPTIAFSAGAGGYSMFYLNRIMGGTETFSDSSARYFDFYRSGSSKVRIVMSSSDEFGFYHAASTASFNVWGSGNTNYLNVADSGTTTLYALNVSNSAQVGGSNIFHAGYSSMWNDIPSGTRTNYTLKFKPATNNYAGFAFDTEDAASAGYLLIRGGTDAVPAYKADGISLIADAGWLTLAQRTTTDTGIRFVTQNSINVAERAQFSADGNFLVGTDDESAMTANSGSIRALGTINTGVGATGAFRIHDGNTYKGGFGSSHWATGDSSNNHVAIITANGRSLEIYTGGYTSASRMTIEADGTIDNPSAKWARTYHQEDAYDSGGTNYAVHTHWGVLCAGSDNGTPLTYTIIDTNISQDQYRMGGFTLLVMDNYGNSGGNSGGPARTRARIDMAGYWNPEHNGGFIGWNYTTTNPRERPEIYIMRNNTTGKVAFAYKHSAVVGSSYPVVVACDLWTGFSGSAEADGKNWSIKQQSNLTGYINSDRVNYVGGNGNYQNADGSFVIEKSSGSMLSHGSYADAIGYNGSYGTYIGGGDRYVYSGGSGTSNSGTHPYYSNGSSSYNITHDAGQIANTYNGDHTFTNTTASAGIKVSNNHTSGGPAIKIHSTNTDGTDWWLISNSSSNTNGAGKLQLWSNNNNFTCATFGETANNLTSFYTPTRIHASTNTNLPTFTTHTSGSVTPTLLANANGQNAHALVVNQPVSSHWAQIISTQSYGLHIDNHVANTGSYLLACSTAGVNQFYVRGDGLVHHRTTTHHGVQGAVAGNADYYSDASNGANIDYYSPNGAQAHMDCRDAGNYSMLHKYTYDGIHGYGQYKENWWDGDSYHTIGSISNAIRTNGDFVATGNITAYGSFSDRRLKENIRPFENARELIKDVDVHRFNYIGKDDDLIGVIAQEIEETLPQLVYELIDTESDEVRKAVRYDHLSAVLLKAVKEQDEEIQELKALVNLLLEKIK